MFPLMLSVLNRYCNRGYCNTYEGLLGELRGNLDAVGECLSLGLVGALRGCSSTIAFEILCCFLSFTSCRVWA